MRIDHQQFVSRKGIAALTLCTVVSDWLGLQTLFLDSLFLDTLDLVAVV